MWEIALFAGWVVWLGIAVMVWRLKRNYFLAQEKKRQNAFQNHINELDARIQKKKPHNHS